MKNIISVNRKVKIACIHIICWLIFLSLPALFNDRIDHLGITSILKDIIAIPPRAANSLFFIGLFYYSYHIAIPAYYFTGKYKLLILYFLITFGIFLLINYLMMPSPFGHELYQVPNDGFNNSFHHSPPHEFHVLGPSHNLFMYLITCICSLALCLYTKWRNVYDEKLNTEISFLKAQINPHFLFNTLNSIYSLALSKSDDTPEAVLKLSGIMRYAVSDATREFVSLDKEINYINDFIELQKLRLHSSIELKYNVSGKTTGKMIAPFILIPFIENPFKYGVNSEERSKIIISINISEEALRLEVWNLKVTTKNNNDSSVGLGIGNTRQRLDLLYDSKHKLTIKETEKDFKVLLKIDFV